MIEDLTSYATLPVPAWNVALYAVAGAGLAAMAARRVTSSRGRRRIRWTGERLLIGLAIAAAAAVAGIGGARSFGAVADRFDSPLVPLTADGMILACTALRLAALARGWRIPGSLLTTYAFIAGTVALNVATAHGWTDTIAHALAPVSYAVLIEMLAHMLRLHLRLATPARPRVTALTWFTSPVVTTRVWLHLARTGSDDPVEARALVQQLIRMASRLRTLCPSDRWLRLDQARAARSAALQSVRDGLLTAGELAALLPADEHLTPAGLFVLVDRASLGLPPAETAAATTPVSTAGTREAVAAAGDGNAPTEPSSTVAPGPARIPASAPAAPAAPARLAPQPPRSREDAVTTAPAGHSGRAPGNEPTGGRQDAAAKTAAYQLMDHWAAAGEAITAKRLASELELSGSYSRKLVQWWTAARTQARTQERTGDPLAIS